MPTPAISEILPGVFHWTAEHARINHAVSSYWLDADGVLIDPMVPAEGLGWFASRPVPPRAIVLSNRHHYRDSGAFLQRFDCGPVRVPRAGLHEFTAGQPVAGYADGDELPGGLRAIDVAALSPDEHLLHRPASEALFAADTVIRAASDPDAPLGFVPDFLIDDPAETKRAMLTRLAPIADAHPFRHLLPAHGLPLLDTGADALRELVTRGGRTSAL